MSPSGYAEQSIKELIIQYCRERSSQQVARYANGQVGNIRNINKERLRQLLMSFDPAWWESLQPSRVAELEALDSVVAVRNAISHGADTGITMARISEYFASINRLLDDLCDRLDPQPIT
jgi:RiboL-PSP-HEPN